MNSAYGLQRDTCEIPFWLLIGVVAVVSIAMHWRIFQLDLMGQHVWRQTQTQTVIENFAQEDFNILNPRINNRGDGDGIFRMEFPIMQWLYAGVYRMCGNHLVITRILSFLTGLLSITGMFFLVKNLFRSTVVAAATAWCFNFSPVFYYYTMNPLPDNFALAMILNALALLFAWRNKGNTTLFIASAIMLSLGALAKLPFILFSVFWLLMFFFDTERKRFSISNNNRMPAIILSGSLLPVFAWYASVIPGWKGNGVVAGILEQTISIGKAADITLHHLISTLPELFLNYAALPLLIGGAYSLLKLQIYKKGLFHIFLLPACCVIGYYFFEINMIDKVHDYYLFPFLPFLFLTVALGFQALFYSERKELRILSLSVLFLVPLTAYLRVDTRWDEMKPGFNADLLKYKQDLKSAVPDTALCITGNDVSGFIFLYYIDKIGWNFKANQLDSEMLADCINRGARYLYCDSRQVDENPQIIQRLHSLVMERGSVRVYELK